MSTDTTRGDCPRCGAKDGLTNVSVSEEGRQWDYGYCQQCGYWYEAGAEGVDTLEEVNRLRAEAELPPLERLADPLAANAAEEARRLRWRADAIGMGYCPDCGGELRQEGAEPVVICQDCRCRFNDGRAGPSGSYVGRATA